MEVGTVRRVDLDQKMRGAYLSYAMSVITSRALPDVRDGLKPVQRRILYAMMDMGLRHDEPTRKCARIVGEVLGKYHPHSDPAVYDALVRMTQDFTMRYPLITGQGNFGSVDGDGAAAIRYTEARLAAIGEELLIDLDKDTVNFSDNFDGTLREPTVLPARLPNLLVNGVSGIAVGMATNIPPHNLGEIVDATVYLIDRYATAEEATVEELMQFVQGPDFPTGATVLGREGIRQAYATGKGAIVMRAQAHIEDLRGGHSAIIITELPYQLNKAGLVERIADLARDGRIEGISDLRDESDSTMRIMVDLKRGVEPGPILSQLLKLTQMQSTFGVNMLALVEGEPRVLSLKRILLHYVEHRREVIERRTRYELAKARARAHILEGLLIALDHLDEVIKTIRESRTAEVAQQNLMTRFKLDELQARAILDMQLRRLAALERKKIEDEYKELQKYIKYLLSLLASKARILAIIKEELLALKQSYGDARRTRILDANESSEFRAEDLVPDEEALVALTRKGLIRRIAASSPNALAALSPADDVLQATFQANSREVMLVLTALGRALQSPVHQVPDVTQQAAGVALRNLVPLASDERVVALLHVRDLGGEGYLSLATRQGKVKRLTLSELASLGSAGGQVIGLADDDTLGWGALTPGNADLLLVTAQGKAIRFQEDTVRPQGRAGSGVRGITLADRDEVVGMAVAREGAEVVLATAQGFAKRSPLPEFSVQGRGGGGLLTLDVERLNLSGPLVGAQAALSDEEVAFVTAAGVATRALVSTLPALPRAGWGRLVTRTRAGAFVRLDPGDTLVAVVCLEGGHHVVAESAPPTQAALPTPATGRGAPVEPEPRLTKSGAPPRVPRPAEEKPTAKATQAEPVEGGTPRRVLRPSAVTEEKPSARATQTEPTESGVAPRAPRTAARTQEKPAAKATATEPAATAAALPQPAKPTATRKIPAQQQPAPSGAPPVADSAPARQRAPETVATPKAAADRQASKVSKASKTKGAPAASPDTVPGPAPQPSQTSAQPDEAPSQEPAEGRAARTRRSAVVKPPQRTRRSKP